VVDTVSVFETGAVPDTIWLIGEKVQPASAGSPMQAKLTEPAKLPCGVRVTVTVPLAPAATVSVDGAIDTASVAAGILIVYKADAVPLVV